MKNEAFSAWLHYFQQQAVTLNERRLVLLVGDDYWVHSLLASANVIENTQALKSRTLVYSDSDIIAANMSLQRFRDKLGSESDYVVFMHSLFSIDAIAALSGTLVAGGVFFLAIKELGELESSLFFSRFLNLVVGSCEHVVLEQDKLILPTLDHAKNSSLAISSSTAISSNEDGLQYSCVTKEQVTAVNAILKVAQGKRKRPLVLTADRGRGKSSALALACAQLINTAKKDNPLHILVTAADINCLSVFFKQLQTSLPAGVFQHNRFTVNNACVEFVAIDQLIKHQLKASLVLIDEAAAIPVYLLESLIKHYHRLVFASTVHGYEGAGRGFTLKFQQRLNLLCPQWRYLHIQQPIRYRDNDPLERLIFNACLLNAELESLVNISANDDKNSARKLEKIDANTTVFQQVSAKVLAENEHLLAQVVSVLVTAHYQTKPSDIKMLLDNPQVILLCLFANINNKRCVVAVAMLMQEGHLAEQSISAADIDDIKHARKRLSNHFTPQSLLTHCGVEEAFSFYYLRVIRIAVHVQLQQQGLGSYFLTKISQFAQTEKADFLAASFGATQNLLAFWFQDDYHLARLGFSKDKASGEHSALVLKALNDKAVKLEKTITDEFYRSFDFLLNDEYQYLQAELIALILHHSPKASLSKLTEHDIANVAAFVQGHRQYACCVFSLYVWLKSQLVNTSLFKQNDIAVLIQRIMQKQSIVEVCERNSFTGKKALEQFLRTKINAIFSA